MLGYLRSGNKRIKAIWWTLTIVTVLSFLIGFSFMGSMGRNAGDARQGNSLGSINSERVTNPMWVRYLGEAQQRFVQSYGTEPIDRDAKQVEQQAWRQMVGERLLAQQAKSVGIGVTDNEVVLGMRTNPPQAILSAQVFQTNGKFDPAKYQQAMANPNIDWSPFESELRDQIPVRKLQERLLSSLKLTQPELVEAFHDRYDRYSATIAMVPPADTGSVGESDAVLQKAFETYGSRLSSPARTQAEVLLVPYRYSEDDIKAATNTAQELYQRALKGEDFATLVRQNSQGPNTANGGVLPRFVNPMELGPIGSTLQTHRPGDVIPPYRENGSVVIFRILDPAKDSLAKNPPQPGMLRLAQLMIKVHAPGDLFTKQLDEAKKMADRARSVGLSKVATEHALNTSKTPFFDLNNTPPMLYAAPAAADWAVDHKKGEVSPVFTGPEEFVIVAVTLQHKPGKPTRDEVEPQLKQIAEIDHRTELAKPRADKFAAALKSGMTLEAAAQSVGLASAPVQFSLMQPDPRLQSSPELLGQLLVAKPGQVIGPVRTPAGWYFGRLDAHQVAPEAMLSDKTNGDKLKGEITTAILTTRQRSFFEGYLQTLRDKASITDSREVH